MGMYDYLGGEQIKIFYSPIFQPKDIMDEKPCTWHSGGALRGFDENDKLPLKTLYYQYPNDFLVFDYRFDYEDVWIIKNGRFNRIESYKNLNQVDIVGPVFSYHGIETNIHTTKDFDSIKKEFRKMLDEHKRIERYYFPEGYAEAIRNNLEEYEKKAVLWERDREKISEDFDKWFPKDKFCVEKKFGEAIDSYIHHRSIKDDKTLGEHYNPYEDYVLCKNYVLSLIEEDKEIIQKYTNWLNDDEMLKEIGFENLINEIKND